MDSVSVDNTSPPADDVSMSMSFEKRAVLAKKRGKELVEDDKVVDTAESKNALQKRTDEDHLILAESEKQAVSLKERPGVRAWSQGQELVGDGKAANTLGSRDALQTRRDKLPGDIDLFLNYRLPSYLLEDIINRLEEARDIALAQLSCKEWFEAGLNVQSLRFTVLNEYHERARDPNYSGKSFGGGPGSSTRDPNYSGKLFGGGPGSSTVALGGKTLKEIFNVIVKMKRFIVQLRIEVEPKLQSKTVPEGERRRTDFWLTDPYFLRQWLPNMGSTLQHLCIVDYGQQAIMRRSSIIKILSEVCKFLKTLDLRNMFIDTIDSQEMPFMVSLTLRCVKVVACALEHINNNMQNLQTLALLGVFGAEGGFLNFKEMKVLCLGLSTPAKEVRLELPKLEKLQLKMQCPEKLIIEAAVLKYVAFNLEVLEPSKVDLHSMVGLEELLYGATSFLTLFDLVGKNIQHLQKLFLDIPCMALGEDGRFLGVIKEINLQLPSFTKLHQCTKLSVLNIGPGLWHSMETQVEMLVAEERWPSVSTLILHMIPHDMESALMVLRLLLRPSVTSLTVFIHSSSLVAQELLLPRIEEIALRQSIMNPKISTWRKSLDFSCFSF